MMRSRNRLAIAVRKPDGDVLVEVRPWFSLTGASILKKPLIRGFPVLLETLVNGLSALNFSAKQCIDEETDGELKPWHMALTLTAAVAMALGLFVVAPHLLSLGLAALKVSGGVDSLSFHLWDGAIKLFIFVGYILAISLVPDVRRVFAYHGAEHKVIRAYEKGVDLSPETVRIFSRLHPRCGTAFVLFVLAISIVLYAVLVPYLMTWWAPQNAVLKQAYVIAMKFFLMIPISSLAFEIIKLSGRFQDNFLCRLLTFPGLALQRLTTKEPDDGQIEVAIAALTAALGESCDDSEVPSAMKD
ncbi:MAG: DUF1385 domain-containing protein [Desulfovibrionaceae bacterium]|nr:DUF1385 domain-containing protein [Desulfovibrionaceae bacterium]MBF0513068.1 DUF1385 domain-containing protein [Desulfovibrionaceae bacterium]